jgi:hypothetical protein
MSNNYRGRYEFAELILQNFQATHGQRVRPGALRKAWADIYFSRADLFGRSEKSSRGQLRHVLRGVLMDPFNIVGWKVLAKILIGWYR